MVCRRVVDGGALDDAGGVPAGGRPLREGRDVASVSELVHAQLHRRPGTVEDARQLLREWRELTREL